MDPQTPNKRQKLNNGSSKPNYSSPIRGSLFKALDNRGTKTKAEVYYDEKIEPSTAKRWEAERRKFGYEVAVRARGHRRSGRRLVLSEVDLNTIANQKKSIREQPYEAQLTAASMPGKVCGKTLQRNLKKRLPGHPQRFKELKVTQLPRGSKQSRVEYGRQHKDRPLRGFWDKVSYSDEVHIDPTSEGSKYILRDEGTREDPENIQERPKKSGVVFHMSASVSWWHISPLKFYNDKHDHNDLEVKKKSKRKRKPKKRKKESEQEHQRRIKDWEAHQCEHKVEIKRAGNSMTQGYYVDNVLPYLVSEIIKLRCSTRRHPNGLDLILLEDNDPSHGLVGQNWEETPASLYRIGHGIRSIRHPANSPDLNPIEACWNILKQRMRHHVFYSYEQYKQEIIAEWNKITLDEVRARITEMPWRMEQVVERGGARIKSKLW